VFIFFFQAEDGIRDLIVTGVQTCALPICDEPRSLLRVLCEPRSSRMTNGSVLYRRHDGIVTLTLNRPETLNAMNEAMMGEIERRSEERRVGKEWRSRWSAKHKKKKKRT